MITLYPFQSTLVSEIRKRISEGHRWIICQSATGSGKTVIFSYMVSEMRKRGKRALIITNRIELLRETGGTLEQFGLSPAEITAGMNVYPESQVYIAMSQTLRNRIEKWPEFFRSFDVVIMDEVHLQEFNVYSGVFDCIVLGFTATPVRTGSQRQLSEDFTATVTGPQVPELIRDGYLVPDRYYGIGEVDMNGVRISSLGDYQENEMFRRFDRPKLYAGVVENWQRIAPGSMTLVFCVNIQHTIKTCQAFNDAGIPAMFLTSDVAKPERGSEKHPDTVKYNEKLRQYEYWKSGFVKWSGDRSDVIARWKAGEFPVLVNAGILTTGFNAPGIETLIVNRATVSVPLWLQILGRGSRTASGKDHFKVLDFGDNGRRLGYYNQQRDWSLIHDSRAKSAGAPPVKECKGKTDEYGKTGCGCYVYASQVICPFCGYKFQIERQVSDVELVAVDYTDIPEWQKLEKYAEQRGYKQGWVIAQLAAKGGRDAVREYGRAKGYKPAWMWQVEKRFGKLFNKN